MHPSVWFYFQPLHFSFCLSHMLYFMHHNSQHRIEEEKNPCCVLKLLPNGRPSYSYPSDERVAHTNGISLQLKKKKKNPDLLLHCIEKWKAKLKLKIIVNAKINFLSLSCCSKTFWLSFYFGILEMSCRMTQLLFSIPPKQTDSFLQNAHILHVSITHNQCPLESNLVQHVASLNIDKHEWVSTLSSEIGWLKMFLPSFSPSFIHLPGDSGYRTGTINSRCQID